MRWNNKRENKSRWEPFSSTKQNAKKKKMLLEFGIGLLSAGGEHQTAVERWGTLSPPPSHFYPLRYEARCNARDLVSSKWQPLKLAKALKRPKNKKKKPSRFLSLGCSTSPRETFHKCRLNSFPTFRSGSTNV